MTEKKALDLTIIKEGDRLRYLGGVTKGLTEGKTYEVIDGYDGADITIYDEDGRYRGVGSAFHNAHCFELVKESEQKTLDISKVKVGDKLRYLGADPEEDGDVEVGSEFEVTSVHNDKVIIDLSPYGSWGVGNDFANLHAYQHVPIDTEDAPTSADPVDNPSHYNVGKFETIEVIEEVTQQYSDGFMSHCVGTAIKYISRAPHKHATPTEDLRKAVAYLEYAIERQTKIEASMVCEEEKIVWNESF